MSRSKTYWLSPAAMRILETLEAAKVSSWIFPGTKPDAHLTDIYYYWNKLRHKRGFPDLQPRDLLLSLAIGEIRQGTHPGIVKGIFGRGISGKARAIASCMSAGCD